MNIKTNLLEDYVNFVDTTKKHNKYLNFQKKFQQNYEKKLSTKL